MKKQLLALAALAALAFAGCAKPQTAWITDIEAAKTESQKTKKDLMVVFTGSDWNDPSKDLIANVFNADFFKKGTKKYVMCNVDIVQNESLMDAEALKANYSVASDYGVQNLPTIALQTNEGDLYASVTPADESKTVEGLFANLDTFKDKRKTIVDMKKKIKSSKGPAKAKAIDAFIETVDSARRNKYAELIRSVPELATGDAADLKGKYQLQIAYLDAMALYQQGNLGDAGKLFIDLAGQEGLTGAQQQEAWYMGAYMNAMSGLVANDQIVAWLQKAYDADPENTGAQSIQATINELKANPVPDATAKK
jgi:hypothetical protein